MAKVTIADLHLTDRERELVDALKGAHGALDSMIAAYVTAVPGWMPTKSAIWPQMVTAADTLKKYGAL